MFYFKRSRKVLVCRLTTCSVPVQWPWRFWLPTGFWFFWHSYTTEREKGRKRKRQILGKKFLSRRGEKQGAHHALAQESVRAIPHDREFFLRSVKSAPFPFCPLLWCQKIARTRNQIAAGQSSSAFRSLAWFEVELKKRAICLRLFMRFSCFGTLAAIIWKPGSPGSMRRLSAW